MDKSDELTVTIEQLFKKFFDGCSDSVRAICIEDETNNHKGETK